jgi:ABC-type Zn uptake system ZnuABC Zn-binding protein ZnuA
MKSVRATALILLLLLLLAVLPFTAAAEETALTVVATSNILADVASHVGGDLVSVTALIPPGADGHAWQPTPADVLKVAQADLVLAVGIGYETFLGGLAENAANVPQVIVSNGIGILPFGGHDHEGEEHAEEHIGIYGEPGVCEDRAEEDHAEESGENGHEHGDCDPHVWTDPNNVIIWANNIAEAFAAADPANAETYRAGAAAYADELKTLDAEIEHVLAVVPEERRVLVTNHEFLSYFAHRYGFRVVGGILGGSTLDEPDPQELADLVETIRALNAPAIFAEVSASSRFADVIASEAGITVVSDLYSESLSGADGPASTYADYLRYNAQKIAEALG